MGPCPSPGFWPFLLVSCQGQCRSGRQSPGLPPKLAVTWDNSLLLSGLQVSPIHSSDSSFKCVCHFWYVHPSIHQISNCFAVHLTTHPSTQVYEHLCVLTPTWVCCFNSSISGPLSGLWLPLALGGPGLGDS